MALLDRKRSSVEVASDESPALRKIDRTRPAPSDASSSKPFDLGHPPYGLIRERAFQIYQARQSDQAPGDATSDWLTAERELCEIAAEEKAAASRVATSPRRFT